MAQEKEHFTARHPMVQPGFGFHQSNGSTQPSILGSPNWTKPNLVQQCKMTLFYLLKASFLIDTTQWKYYDDKTLQIQDTKAEDQALCQESGEDRDNKPHTLSTPTTSLCPRLVSDSNSHHPFLLPKVVEQAPAAVGMPDPPALSKKPTPKVLFTQAAMGRASSTAPHRNTTSGLFLPLWYLQHPVKGDSASPVAWELMELRRSSQNALPHWAEQVWTGGSLWESCTEYEIYSNAKLVPTEG